MSRYPLSTPLHTARTEDERLERRIRRNVHADKVRRAKQLTRLRANSASFKFIVANETRKRLDSARRPTLEHMVSMMNHIDLWKQSPSPVTVLREKHSGWFRQTIAPINKFSEVSARV